MLSHLGGDVILFESAGLETSTGKVPETIAGMAKHTLAFLDGLGVEEVDVPGFCSLAAWSLSEIAMDRPSIVRRMIFIGTAPRGGEDIMHLEKPSLAKHLADPKLQGYAVLQKLFFAPTKSSRTAGAALSKVARLREDREPASGPAVVQAQMAAFRDWEQFTGERFADLKRIPRPVLVVNKIYDEMIPIQNSYWLTQTCRTRF